LGFPTAEAPIDGWPPVAVAKNRALFFIILKASLVAATMELTLLRFGAFIVCLVWGGE
jgi:hypothetical protein